MIKEFLYPEFDCENCNGMCHLYGKCECDYHGAVAPGVGPSKLIRVLRRVWQHVAIDFGRDRYRRCGVLFQIALFRRPSAEIGTHAYRFNAELHLSLQRGFVLWLMTHPAWKDVPSVNAEYERTMHPRPYRNHSTEDLVRTVMLAKWELNTVYGYSAAPAVNLVDKYSHIAAIRRELKLRKESA